MPAVVKYSDPEALEILRHACQLGFDASHTYDEYARQYGLPSHSWFAVRFGSWNRAKSLIGWSVRPQRGMDGSPDRHTSRARRAPTTSHWWTLEDAEGRVVYKEFTYPPIRIQRKYLGHSIVRVDYTCAG